MYVHARTNGDGHRACLAVMREVSPADIFPALEMSHRPGHESLQSAHFYSSNSPVLST